jgi:hypothetical protein
VSSISRLWRRREVKRRWGIVTGSALEWIGGFGMYSLAFCRLRAWSVEHRMQVKQDTFSNNLRKRCDSVHVNAHGNPQITYISPSSVSSSCLSSSSSHQKEISLSNQNYEADR